jgi:hypothetical protein
MENKIEEIVEREKEISNRVATGELKIRIMEWATNFARDNSQTIGKRNDYCITLQQLERFLQN